MPSSRHLAGLVAALILVSSAARGQTAGFTVERFYPSAPGGGWLVMDALDMHGGFGAAVSLTLGYAHNPLVVQSAGGPLALVSDQAFADLGVALSYDRVRIYANVDSPLAVKGQSGSAYEAPDVTLGNSPDTVSDVRLGVDFRAVGRARDPLRLGVSAQLYCPSGNRADFVTDGTFRAMVRLLLAGDAGPWAYAAHLGIHIRPLEQSIPGGADADELLFGAALGRRVPVSALETMDVIAGPELFGQTALRTIDGASTTGVEALLSVRLEGTQDNREQLRLKAGVGVGLDANFGTPQWRLVLSAEGFDFTSRRFSDLTATPSAPAPLPAALAR